MAHEKQISNQNEQKFKCLTSHAETQSAELLNEGNVSLYRSWRGFPSSNMKREIDERKLR